LIESYICANSRHIR